MSNPFHKSSRIKHLLSILVLVAFTFSFTPIASAQGDFDFADDSDSEEGFGGDDFDFAEDTPAPLDLSEHFEMPNNGKPVNLVIFEPVDSTPEKTLDNLTEATVDALKDEKYAEYDSVKGVPVLQKLDTMSADDRMLCIDDAECMANIGAEIGAANIIIGRIYTEGRDRPSVTLDLIDVNAKINKNSIFFDTQSRLRKQEQDIAGALIRLFNIDTGSLDSLLGERVVEETNPLPLGQMIGGIVVGVIAAAAVGTGIYFGLEAKNYEDKVKDAVKANQNVGAKDLNTSTTEAVKYNELVAAKMTQKDAKDNYDKAKDYAMYANILYASGAVAAVVSVILFLVRSDKDEDIFSNGLYVAPAVNTEGAGVVTGFTF